MKRMQAIYERNPLRFILFLAFLIRLLAAIFSRGYGMHDDHFLVIEAAQSFADGFDYNNWLPWNNSGVPSGHSWFYVGMHFILFKVLNFIGLDDPQLKMVVVRFFHALYSLLVVLIGYRITRKIGTEKDAVRVAWMLALLWFIPSTSVRNLVEWVCVPPLMLTIYFLMKSEDKEKVNLNFLLSGICAGIALSIRFQSMFFLVGLAVYLLWKKEFRGSLFVFFGFAISFFATQSVDLFFYGRPFAEITEYINYNLINATTYFDRPWYQYIFTVAGMLVPPISVFLIIGYFKAWKKALIIILPSLTFFLFHSWFPNKQERFILPFFPFIIMAGVIGWGMIREGKLASKAEKFAWNFFWTLNIAAMLVVSFTYSKRSMVESMYFLYKQNDYNNFIMEVSHRDSQQWPPQFYTGKWNSAYCIYQGYTVAQLMDGNKETSNKDFPRYVLFFQDNDLESRVAKFRSGTGKNIQLVFTAEPSWFDSLLHWLNPRNKNEPVYIYRIS